MYPLTSNGLTRRGRHIAWVTCVATHHLVPQIFPSTYLFIFSPPQVPTSTLILKTTNTYLPCNTAVEMRWDNGLPFSAPWLIQEWCCFPFSAQQKLAASTSFKGLITLDCNLLCIFVLSSPLEDVVLQGVSYYPLLCTRLCTIFCTQMTQLTVSVL